MTNDQQILASASMKMYTLLRGTVKGAGWHDNPESHFSKDSYLKHEDTFFKYIEDLDVDLFAYCVLACTLARVEHFRAPLRLYGRRNLMKWFKDLREYCGSREAFTELASLIYCLLEYQGNFITTEKKMVYFTFSNLVKDVDAFLGSEDKGTYLQAYHTLVDRIQDLKEKKIDPSLWIIAKYEKCIKAFDDNIAFSALANNNSLEPDMSKLKKETKDEWRDIRRFLGVSPSCEFVDGSIPKGWRPALGDRRDIEEIVKVKKDGYYMYPDGTQYKGCRHYSDNSYLVISCTVENFELFKKDWDNKRLLGANPTWEEYDKWGPEERFWDKDGESINGRGRSVKWRKK